MVFPSIGKATGEGVLDSQAWNVADGYTKIKILRLLIQLDIDEEIAMFGKKDDLDQIFEGDIPYKRIEAYDKFIFHLKQLIGNCKFTIEPGFDKRLMEEYLDRLKQVEDVSEGVASYFINDMTKERELKIDEVHFKKCFDILHDIKNDINHLLNHAGLIFRQSDELDLDAVMRSIEEGG